jgi:preprotein translocase subunit SecG
MSLLIGFLTAVLVLNCIFLVLLVLIQLPKKEAGLGVAFGGAATDALFGAGSGTVLTKVTKYCATLFVVLALVLSILNTYRANRTNRSLQAELEKQAASAALQVPAQTNATGALTSTPSLLLSSTNVAPSNPPAAPPQ